MRLYEYEGKDLFRKYGIRTPSGTVLAPTTPLPSGIKGGMVKAQVYTGDRFKAGGILETKTPAETKKAIKALFDIRIHGERVEKILVEERVVFEKEQYVSFSYDSHTRGPVVSLNTHGGTGITEARVFPIDLLWGMPSFFLRDVLLEAGFPLEDIAGLSDVLTKLWDLFLHEHALLAEINPLFKTTNGYVAGDAKIILDSEKLSPTKRPYIDMDGDIAILASGGGASMLNMDALLLAGGKPANYTEYSGNPPAAVVKELTKKVLSKKGLRACWVVGAAANFTDIHTTLTGFLDGLRETSPQPRYPIVIRRDGPNCAEAFTMLREAGAKEGYDFHLYDSHTPMHTTADTVVALAYGRKKNI